MAGKKVLTKKVAEKLLSAGCSADLGEFTAIDDDAAESLGRFWSYNLRLNGLTNISDAAVEALANNESGLNLDGLATLTDAAAASLSRFKGRTLSLNGLASLSDDAALSLSKSTGLALVLNGLTSLSDVAAESLSKKMGWQSEPGFLYLNGLTSLSDSAAASFCQRPSHFPLHIQLEGLKSLADSPAQLELLRRLTESWYTIRLNSLESLSEAQAEILKNLKGNSKNSSELELNGLTTLSDSVVKILGKCKCETLQLNGLKSLSGAGAKGLGKFKCSLQLNGLTVLTDAAADGLGTAKCYGIELNGLTSLEDSVVEAFAKQEGRLYLNGLAALSDKAGKALAKRKNDLSLKRLTTLSEVVAKAFANRKFYELSLSRRASESVAKALAGPDGPRPERADPSGTITNSLGMKLIPISAGKFLMGSPENEKGRAELYELQHKVTLTQDFYLGMTQVTQAQYEQVMGINLSRFKGKEVSGRDSSEFPVEMVSWDDAVEFCRKLSEIPEEKAAGRVYRLPTEAEWEYACRAGSGTAFCFGGDEESLDEYAWYHEKGSARPRPVALKEPNLWGLYDMHGNVWEWCSDWYVPYSKKAVTDPVGPEAGQYGSQPDRVRRGGSFRTQAERCRSAAREGRYPSDRSYECGLRVALSSMGIPK